MNTPKKMVFTTGEDFMEFRMDGDAPLPNSRVYLPLPLDYFKEMRYLSNEEFGELIRILLWFAISGEVVPVEGVLCHYIDRVIERQKRFYRDWDKLRKSRSAAGKKGADSRWKGDSEFHGSKKEKENDLPSPEAEAGASSSGFHRPFLPDYLL